MTRRVMRPRAPYSRMVSCRKCGTYYRIVDDDPGCPVCQMLTTAEVSSRARSLGECALCGRPLEMMEDGVLTHLESERDEFHRAMLVNAG